VVLETADLKPHPTAGGCYMADLLTWFRQFWKFRHDSWTCFPCVVNKQVTNIVTKLQTQVTKNNTMYCCYNSNNAMAVFHKQNIIISIFNNYWTHNKHNTKLSFKGGHPYSKKILYLVFKSRCNTFL